mgnify:FL=1
MIEAMLCDLQPHTYKKTNGQWIFHKDGCPLVF